ncbi:hypothetical protein NEDG_00883 [Nematocida displodere]|uniref:Uncharacterized protein n=1 Tax=Nematocida displodere TaxID=1805483 RepID=A0A177EEA8_9MICR|nr:hypothetical protein NEDG_00883 [Nematocida displodere]
MPETGTEAGTETETGTGTEAGVRTGTIKGPKKRVIVQGTRPNPNKPLSMNGLGIAVSGRARRFFNERSLSVLRLKAPKKEFSGNRTIARILQRAVQATHAANPAPSITQTSTQTSTQLARINLRVLPEVPALNKESVVNASPELLARVFREGLGRGRVSGTVLQR